MFDGDEDDLAFALDATRATLRVEGAVFTDLDARRLEREIDAAARTVSERLVVDLGGVTFLPSLAIQALVLARRRGLASGCTIELHAVRGSLPQRVLSATGIPVDDSGSPGGSRPHEGDEGPSAC